MRRRKQRHQRFGGAGQVIARRLRELREAAGLTQGQVAAHLKLPRSAVSEMESGKRDVLAVELFELARLLGRPVEALVAVEPAAEAGDVMMRALPASTSGVPRPEIGTFFAACRLYHELEAQAGDARPPALRAVAREVATFRQAQQLADEERERLDLGATPGRLLLDLLEERLRIKVIALPLPADLSGCSVVSPVFGAAILVNRDQTGGRQVFTLAHEYFHLLTARQFAAARAREALSVCGGQLGRPASGKPKIEQLADQFAGRLLLPPAHFVERLQALRKADGTIDRLDLIEVARYFGVSVQAVFVGLARLRLVPWELANAAYADRALQAAIVRAGGEVVPQPARFRRLAAMAVRAGRLTRARLAEALQISVAEVERELARLGSEYGARKVKLARSG
jgi:Zn-dependent peptidase ImmA (M78 family)/DNA-binding XRE family transcriptional regulator